MRVIGSLTIAWTLLLCACTGSSQGQQAAQASAATPSTPSLHSYRCESGEVLTAVYPSTDTATVHYKARSYQMQSAVSASGARYVGDKLEWWTKGSGAGAKGMLLRHNADGTPGDKIEACTQS